MLLEVRDPPSGQSHTAAVAEYKAVATASNELSCWMEGIPGAACRVFFRRDSSLRPVTQLEAYVGFLFVDGRNPWCKVYACGEGVTDPEEQSGPIPWYLDAFLGDLPPSLETTDQRRVDLKIYRCWPKEGTVLGIGQLTVSDVELMDQERPVAVFSWQYASHSQLEALGAVDRPASIPDSLADAIAFLRGANRLLLSMMTQDQRLQFIDRLAATPEILSRLPYDMQNELRVLSLANHQQRLQQPDTPASTPGPASQPKTQQADEASGTRYPLRSRRRTSTVGYEEAEDSREGEDPSEKAESETGSTGTESGSSPCRIRIVGTFGPHSH
ncbi:hypothetical protein Rt10032_c01g0421 [Rhodotorula toruloides]|uniref:Uncharacterized protein n=1 Tax=Rhodotorula toruloides TaxID=5286 RepID=A0A511KAB2_RHOTO|nr:hypothetical protein Rt10032_c01g0421 [Rhodotorula toruloides]